MSIQGDGGSGRADAGVRVVRHGAALRLTLSRPEVKNALSGAMVTTLLTALEEAAASDDARVVVLAAEGANFCTGVDLTEANRRPDTRPKVGNHRTRVARGAHRLIKALFELELPVVAGVRGWAGGIGNALALSADYVVASRTAMFWSPYTTRGFTPDSGTTYLLPRLVGVHRAKEMILLGRPVDAAKALEWGLVNEVVDDEELDVAVERIVGEFANAATLSVGLAKRLIHRALDLDLDEALLNESEMLEVSLRSDDFKEGIASFGERRDPTYTGR